MTTANWSPCATTTGSSSSASSARPATSISGRIRLPACGCRRSSTCAWIPIERADIASDQYNDWLVHNVYLNVQGQILGTEFMETFKEYPPSQAPASFTVNPDAILDMLKRQQAALAKD